MLHIVTKRRFPQKRSPYTHQMFVEAENLVYSHAINNLVAMTPFFLNLDIGFTQILNDGGYFVFFQI